MGCFLACFGFSKKRKRRRLSNRVAAAGGDHVNSLIYLQPQSEPIYRLLTFGDCLYLVSWCRIKPNLGFYVLLQRRGSYVPLDSSLTIIGVDGPKQSAGSEQLRSVLCSYFSIHFVLIFGED